MGGIRSVGSYHATSQPVEYPMEEQIASSLLPRIHQLHPRHFSISRLLTFSGERIAFPQQKCRYLFGSDKRAAEVSVRSTGFK